MDIWSAVVYLFIFKDYLKELQRQKKRDRPSASALSKWPQYLGLD